MKNSREKIDRQLRFASRQARKGKKFSFFARYDELTGVLACPGVKLKPLHQCSFTDDYKKRAASELLYARGEKISWDFQ